MTYANRTRRPPRTLTDGEVKAVLHVTGQRRDTFRDHVVIALALATGLRKEEVRGLDISDVVSPAGNVRHLVQLRVFKGSGRAGADPAAQRFHLEGSAYYKLEKYIRVTGLADLVDQPERQPLFDSRNGNRLSLRAIDSLWRKAQQLAGFDQVYGFHILRHTAISRVQRAGRDIRKTQLFARHADINTTMIYEHASTEELAQLVRGIA